MKSIHLLVFINAVLIGQWETINQPDLGTISEIISGGNGLIAATNQAQVYQSIDEGNSWQLLGDTLPTQPYGADLLFEKNKIHMISAGNIEDDFNLVSEADWVIEVVVEQIDIKHSICF